MHVRLASIHSLTSSGGVNTKPTMGRTDSLPDSDMHCLPVNPTTKRYFGSLEGLMLVPTILSLRLFNTKKETEVKKNQQNKQTVHTGHAAQDGRQCFYEERRQTNTDKDKTTRHDDRQEIRPIRQGIG